MPSLRWYKHHNSMGEPRIKSSKLGRTWLPDKVSRTNMISPRWCNAPLKCLQSIRRSLFFKHIHDIPSPEHEIPSLQSLVGDYKHVVSDYHYGYDVSDVISSYIKERNYLYLNTIIQIDLNKVMTRISLGSMLLVEEVTT